MPSHIESDTIAAVATPAGTGGIAVVRVSGPRSIDIADRTFFSAAGASLREFASHTAHHAELIHPETRETVDDAVFTVFRAPRSYTGEDVVEVSCHGGAPTVRAALQALLAAGARPAEPGEFTRRAFAHGRIDLAQAEAVNDLVRARTDEARRVALRQLDGKLSARIREARGRILGAIAAIEAAVDFPDDVPDPDCAWLESEIAEARRQVEGLLKSFGAGRALREGIRVVIAGRVNVGKSSLLNALVRRSRAIVTPIPGTTRDLVEEMADIRGIPVLAIDTAGLRATDDPVERIGVELAQRSLESADIVLFVVEAPVGVTDEDLDLFRQMGDRRVIVIANKVDLLPEKTGSLAIEQCRGTLGRSVPLVGVSAASGEGIERLEGEIADLIGAAGLGAEGVIVSNVRHQRALESALDSLACALDTLGRGAPIDLVTVDLTASRDSLGLVTGETASEDLLDRIFGEFCIGK